MVKYKILFFYHNQDMLVEDDKASIKNIIEKFENKVNRYLQEDWKLHGNIIVKDNIGIQAIIKEENK
jgi:hypothetical protein